MSALARAHSLERTGRPLLGGRPGGVGGNRARVNDEEASVAQATAYSKVVGWYDSFLLFGRLRIESPAKRASASIADGLFGGNGDGLTCSRVLGGVLGSDVHGKDPKARHLDAVPVDEFEGEFLNEAGIDGAAFADGQAEVFGDRVDDLFLCSWLAHRERFLMAPRMAWR